MRSIPCETAAPTPLPRRYLRVLIIAVLLLGVALRLYHFPSVPAGLNQDEISEAYESVSLLYTGADRWGHHLPAYFLSWGSGQNVLQSYLQLPAIALWGLTPLGARALPMLCGLLTLPLFALTIRRWHSTLTACFGLLFLALAPWHVIASRWALESNLLPFFLLLGIATVSLALRHPRPLTILLACLPFAIALYAYGIAVVIVPPLLLLLLLSQRRALARAPRAWISSVLLATLVAAPFAFFVFKNYVTKRNYAFEAHLPITIPLLPITRLSQVNAGSPLLHNLLFFRHSLQDMQPWNQIPGLRPLPWFVLLLALVGIASTLRSSIKCRSLQDPFALWLLSSLPLLLLVSVNINQANTLFLPLLAMAAIGVETLATTPRLLPYRNPLLLSLLALTLVSGAIFAHRYFGPTQAAATAETFHPDLPPAMHALATRQRPGQLLYITDTLNLNYVQTLFYLRIPPRTFQTSGATYDRPDFGPFRFSRATLPSAPTPLLYLLSDTESPLCPNPRNQTRFGSFLVGECP